MQKEKPIPIPQLLAARKYDPNRQPEPEQILLTIGGKKVGSIQNLVTFTGKQKNGKSRFIGATIASGISQQEIFKIRLRTPHGRNRIALFDTEQSDYDFFKQMQQIKKFACINDLPHTFDAFNTREDEPLATLQMVDHYLAQNPDCSIIFLDGILDLLMDFNNVIESKRLTNYFKKITKERNCLLIGVLHRGKGNDMTVGNIGSMADRLAQSVIKVEKNKERNTYCMSSDFMRSDEDFSPVEIFYNNGIWEETFHIPGNEDNKVKPLKLKPHEWDISEHITTLPQIFNSTAHISYENLIDQIKEVYAVGRNWAVDCIKHLRNEGLIFRHTDGYSTNNQAKLYIQQ
jgi:hypothetical protein